MHIFDCLNIGTKCSSKILEVIDLYLSLFSNEAKETREYLIIYNKFKDLFQMSEKINLLNEKEEMIQAIEKRIISNYK